MRISLTERNYNEGEFCTSCSASSLFNRLFVKADAEIRSIVYLRMNHFGQTFDMSSFGFSVKDTFTVGEDDETWKEDPIIVELVRTYISVLIILLTNSHLLHRW